MFLIKRMILALMLCFAGFGVFAQTANDVINKYIDAMGGKAKLLQLNAIYEEITTSMMGQDIPSKVWIVNNKGMRTEMSIMGQKMTMVVTKDTGWMVNPMMGNSDPQPLPMEQIKQSMGRLDIRGQLVDYAAKGYALTLLGKEAVNGKTNYKIKIAKAGDPDFIYFIDATTYLISKVETDIKANGSVITTDAVMEDYRKTPEGYTFPFSTTVTVQTGEIKSVVNKITVNPTVAPALFQKP
jgi:hypothetical protein